MLMWSGRLRSNSLFRHLGLYFPARGSEVEGCKALLDLKYVLQVDSIDVRTFVWPINTKWIESRTYAITIEFVHSLLHDCSSNDCWDKCR
jgi:hypothetical protein